MNDPSDDPDREAPRDSEALFVEVYQELRRIAAAKMASLNPTASLQATALVHELYLRFQRRELPGWEDRDQFLFAAARAMRDILIEALRKKERIKRGGDRKRLVIELDHLEVAVPDEEIEQVHESLDRLESEHPEHAKLVLLRYFAGLSAAEVARALGISGATYRRRWRFAWAWLQRDMSSDD